MVTDVHANESMSTLLNFSLEFVSAMTEESNLQDLICLHRQTRGSPMRDSNYSKVYINVLRLSKIILIRSEKNILPDLIKFN